MYWWVTLGHVETRNSVACDIDTLNVTVWRKSHASGAKPSSVEHPPSSATEGLAAAVI